MGTGRSKYTEEYKAAAVERLYEPGVTLGKVAKELGLTPTQLKMWRLEIEAAGLVEAKRRQQGGETMRNKHLFIATHAKDYVVSKCCRLLVRST
ncbi:Transposase [Pseudovibrio axinellae]|uniref:Transposase n=1 Tax=Pseudovibrio axinellae TaxID=989403 RepID=A0A165T3B5_9HYPH|nr:transposase [Pseudovibrio axinellae]KZL05367.1 Transposase [Pseudovibrio axinellae]SER36854.1 Transposase [Pseudovibrio axinellae]